MPKCFRDAQAESEKVLVQLLKMCTFWLSVIFAQNDIFETKASDDEPIFCIRGFSLVLIPSLTSDSRLGLTMYILFSRGQIQIVGTPKAPGFPSCKHYFTIKIVFMAIHNNLSENIIRMFTFNNDNNSYVTLQQ